MNTYVMGVDIGSSALKATILTERGSIAGSFRREIQSAYPQPGWVDQDPDEWFDLFCDVLKEVYASGIGPDQIAAIVPSAATHTTVLLDEDFRPLRSAILWNDQRSAKIAERLKEQYGDMIFARTYHQPTAMWSLCQSLWVHENERESWQKVRRLMFAKDYFRHQLTADYATDYIDAQGSLFFDMDKRAWDEELCALLGFTVDQLPVIKKPADLAGTVTDEAARRTGLKAGTKVFMGTTDTALEILASGAVSVGQATVKLATSGRICVVSDYPYPHPLLVNYSHVIEGLWYPGTGTRSCATSLRWFKDQFCRSEIADAERKGISVYQTLYELAGSVPAGSEGLIYHPYLLGEFTPYNDPDLRASFTGFSMKHTHAHFARAVMEGCVYSLRDCLMLVQSLDMPDFEEIRLIGGGAMSDVWSHIVADVFGCDVVRPVTSDSSFAGALVAGVGMGFFADYYDAVHETVRLSEIIRPDSTNRKAYDLFFGHYKDIQKNLAGIYQRLSTDLEQL